MQPVERPTYRLEPVPGALRIHVDALDWAGLLGIAALALSDAIRPIGCFDTWTARRASARGKDPAEVLERWLGITLHDLEAAGFLSALVEVERAEPGRAAGILRGGIPPDDAGPAARPLRAIVPGSVVVEPGAAGRPWRAQFDAR